MQAGEMVLVAAAAASLFSIPSGVAAQTVRGFVRETGKESVLSGATVTLLGPKLEIAGAAVTDDAGHFELHAARDGEYSLRVERIGYATSTVGPLRLEKDDVTDVTLRLAVDAVPLDALTVEVDAARAALQRVGYYDRKRVGHGRYIERVDIEKRQPDRTSDLLRGINGVRLVTKHDGTDVVFRAAGLTSFSQNRDTSCMPPVYLDGLIVSHPKVEAGERYDIDSLHWNDIEAIEVYASPSQVPPQYGGAYAACGVMLIWTRRGGTR